MAFVCYDKFVLFKRNKSDFHLNIKTFQFTKPIDFIFPWDILRLELHWRHFFCLNALNLLYLVMFAIKEEKVF